MKEVVLLTLEDDLYEASLRIKLKLATQLVMLLDGEPSAQSYVKPAKCYKV